MGRRARWKIDIQGEPLFWRHDRLDGSRLEAHRSAGHGGVGIRQGARDRLQLRQVREHAMREGEVAGCLVASRGADDRGGRQQAKMSSRLTHVNV